LSAIFEGTSAANDRTETDWKHPRRNEDFDLLMQLDQSGNIAILSVIDTDANSSRTHNQKTINPSVITQLVAHTHTYNAIQTTLASNF
jgi:hypothetical protein